MTGGQKQAATGDLLTPADYESLAAFRLALRRYLAFTEAGAKAAGLTVQQHQALLAIKAQAQIGPLSIGDLANQLLIKHHSAVELVGRLEKAGLTRRAADAGDGRKVLIILTPKGESMLAALSATNLKELRVVAPVVAGLVTHLSRLDLE